MTTLPESTDRTGEADLSACPYYQTRGLPDGQRGVCESGCVTEPSCITDEPNGGWPSGSPAAECNGSFGGSS